MPPTAGSSTASLYIDLASPDSYLAAERVLQVLDGPCEWVPVVAGRLGASVVPAEGDHPAWRQAVERRAAEQGLQRVRWPATFPFDGGPAARAATYAKAGGKTVAFCLAAFRQAFAGGRDLSVVENVTIAAAACEIHPRALLVGMDSRGTRRALDQAVDVAAQRGVRALPAIWTGDEVVSGPDAPERAAAALRT